jgi:hypothetical protein
MSKDELLQLLKEQTSIKNLKFPEDIDISLQDDRLTITMTPKGLTSNMQDNSAAFEGWAMAIKATLDKPDIPIHIVWACDDTSIRTKPHYIRFLYRVIRFQENYGNDAAIVLKPKDQNAQNDLDRISRELSECRWYRV